MTQPHPHATSQQRRLALAFSSPNLRHDDNEGDPRPRSHPLSLLKASPMACHLVFSLPQLTTRWRRLDDNTTTTVTATGMPLPLPPHQRHNALALSQLTTRPCDDDSDWDSFALKDVTTTRTRPHPSLSLAITHLTSLTTMRFELARRRDEDEDIPLPLPRNDGNNTPSPSPSPSRNSQCATLVRPHSPHLFPMGMRTAGITHARADPHAGVRCTLLVLSSRRVAYHATPESGIFRRRP